MPKQRFNITIHPELVKRAHEIMRRRMISNFSECLEILIREEWEAHESNPPPSPIPAALEKARKALSPPRVRGKG